jgi:hypothetical protein
MVPLSSYADPIAVLHVYINGVALSLALSVVGEICTAKISAVAVQN